MVVVSEEAVKVEVLEVLEADPVLDVVVDADLTSLYWKMAMHEEPPHNSPAFPVQGISPGILSEAMKHTF